MKRIITGFIIALLLGVFIGFMIGYSQAITFCIDVASAVLDIRVNEDIMKEIILRYGERVI